MLYRIYCIESVLVFVLVACSGTSQSVTPRAQDSKITLAPTSSETLTPTPTETPFPTATTMATASITPTSTLTPENFLLAESGFDIADVRISQLRQDTVRIDFNYRIDPNKKSTSEVIVIGVWFPPACAGVNGGDTPVYRDDPTFMQNGGVEVSKATGRAQLTYRQESPGKCEMSSFELVITFMHKFGINSFNLRDVYREHIRQPIKIINSTTVVKFSDMVATKNFAFQVTGPWMGKLTFDYAVSPEFSDRVLHTQFRLDGQGDILYCRFEATGRYVTELQGTYEINIDMNQYNLADKRSISCHDKLEQNRYLTFDQVKLALENDWLYGQYIDFKITLKK